MTAGAGVTGKHDSCIRLLAPDRNPAFAGWTVKQPLPALLVGLSSSPVPDRTGKLDFQPTGTGFQAPSRTGKLGNSPQSGADDMPSCMPDAILAARGRRFQSPAHRRNGPSARGFAQPGRLYNKNSFAPSPKPIGKENVAKSAACGILVMI
jgi:hypothetical protein